MSIEQKSNENSPEELVWFAMSATFGRSMKAKAFLESKQVKCFIPMRYEMTKDKTQGKVKRLIPAINNLIFVYTTKQRIQALKSVIEYLQYLTHPIDGRNVPIIVPVEQMQQFIAVCDTLDERLTYLSPDEINLEKGTPVKIIGSAFDGVVGTFVKVHNSRKKRVVVLVQGVTAVMLAEFTDGYLQPL